VKFQVFTVVKIQVEVFWIMTSYSDVLGYHCFGGPCYFHHHTDDEGSKVLQNTGILSQPRRPNLASEILP
jgi:hypothetical protein